MGFQLDKCAKFSDLLNTFDVIQPKCMNKKTLEKVPDLSNLDPFGANYTYDMPVSSQQGYF